MLTRLVGRGASALALALVLSGSSLPPSTLAVRQGDEWRVWWSADRAPRRWPSADTLVTRAVAWHPLAPGIEWAELRLAGTSEAKRLRVILARLDPRAVRLRLDVTVRADGHRGFWSIDDAPAAAVLAVNAGQFTEAGPWGWVVLDGRELRPPGVGPLADAFVVDSAGSARFVDAADVARVRAETAGHVAMAFQSYPANLRGDGEIPAAVMEDRSRGGGGLDVAHRDARLALGELRDGRLLLALTRFDGVGETLGFLPFGLTVPEMAAVMGALGARRAMLLDGGISGQLLLRSAGGQVRSWHGMRRVPLGMVVEGRP